MVDFLCGLVIGRYMRRELCSILPLHSAVASARLISKLPDDAVSFEGVCLLISVFFSSCFFFQLLGEGDQNFGSFDDGSLCFLVKIPYGNVSDISSKNF